MIRAAILSLVLIMAGFSSASASECGKLCDRDWWKTATQEEVAAEIATVDVNARDDTGSTPLHWTASRGTVANVTALLQRGAKVNARKRSGATPLIVAAGKDTAMVIALLDAGADVNVRGLAAMTPLHWAAFSGSSASVIALLAAGADGRARDDTGYTPFFYADTIKRREEFVGTEGYWALHDAQYD
ncbi:MAG: ankyrin repeat domain-containing protein [Paracoccaceae bacterium]|nr:ankyrin repeat domain-containing protein [Paracoccaceae bacterium]MDG1370719.1 ankyrin repeat domain-containing protein [Paracoccaceae bacterium]